MFTHISILRSTLNPKILLEGEELKCLVHLHLNKFLTHSKYFFQHVLDWRNTFYVNRTCSYSVFVRNHVFRYVYRFCEIFKINMLKSKQHSKNVHATFFTSAIWKEKNVTTMVCLQIKVYRNIYFWKFIMKINSRQK